MADLLQMESGLAHYCTNSWFRLLKEPKQKGHTHEQETHEIWQEVQNAFQKWFPGVAGHQKECKRHKDGSLVCSVEQDVAQSRGCLAKAVAFLSLQSGIVIDTVEDAIAFAVTELRKQGLQMLASVQEKSNEIIVRNNLALSLIDPLNDVYQYGNDFWAEIIGYDYGYEPPKQGILWKYYE